MFRATATILLLAAVAGLAAANTNGTRFEGYTFVSDKTGYVNMTLDYCDISNAISAGNWEEALAVYASGKNSVSGASFRTFYRFASLNPSSPEQMVDRFNNGRNVTWLDEAIRAAFAAENGPLALGLIQVGLMKYFFHEMESGQAKLVAYAADPTLEVQISDARGAPSNVDELYALWAGGRSPNCGTLSSWARTLGNEMDTVFVGQSIVNEAMVNLLTEMLHAARTGNLDGFNVQRDRLIKTMIVLGLQGVSHSAYKVALATKCGRPAADVEEAKSWLAVHWAYLEPLLASRRTAPSFQARWDSLVVALGRALTANPPNYGAVRIALMNVMSGHGRVASEVGAPSFTKINRAWSCPASARP